MHDVIDDNTLHIVELIDNGQPDEALACLDTIWEANRHRDHTGSLARSIALQREFILCEAERYEEALAMCDIREQLGFENITDSWGLGASRARNLEGLGRHAEALAVFEKAFREQDPRYLSGARYWMTSLVEYSENAGRPVDESWREVVQRIADGYEVELPVRDSLGETILALYELTEGKQPKSKTES
jgi:tetratricopeptide (TPR) repeat protein